MAVPDFQTLFRPLLEVLEDGQEHQVSDVRDQLAAAFSLSDADLQEMIPSGRVTTFKNRVGWATTYLYRTRLIDRPKRPYTGSTRAIVKCCG
jgi:restriction system protein